MSTWIEPAKPSLTPEETAALEHKTKEYEKLETFVPALTIGPFFWGLKSLLTVFFGGITLNVFDTFCRAAPGYQIFLSGSVAFSYIFLFIWSWIFIGPISCSRLLPIVIAYSIYGVMALVWGILGTIWYSLGRYGCAEETPALAREFFHLFRLKKQSFLDPPHLFITSISLAALFLTSAVLRLSLSFSMPHCDNVYRDGFV